MTEKRFSVRKSGTGLFYRDGNYEIDNTIQFVVETVEMKLNQLYDENEQLKRLFDEADDLILSQCTTHYQRQWENIKKNIKGDVE